MMATWRHSSLLLLSTLMLFQDSWTASTGDGGTCPSPPPYSYHLDIFEEILSNHTDLADSLDLAPVLLGMNTNSPAYKFQGYGFHLTSTNVSNAIRSASCSSNEVTLSTGILFTDSDADGTLFELSYADRAEAGVPVYAVQMDAPADEIRVAYRHQGQLHVEVIPIRLHGGRWRTYAIELSGNQLTVYVNCERDSQRLVPLPDYCINDADVVVSVADTAYSHSEEFSGRERLHVFLQNLGIQFGPGGINRYCPDLPEACPTCGQYLTMVEKVFTLQKEKAVLEQQVASLEATGTTLCNTANDATSTVTNESDRRRMNDCVDDTHPSGEIRTFPHDTFSILADGRICYCNDGNKRCTTTKEVCVVDEPVATVPPSAVADTDAPPVTSGVCRVAEFGGIELLEGDFESRLEIDQCQVFSCEFKVAGFRVIDSFYSCSDAAYQNCSGLITPLQKEVSSCCGICDECSVKRCPANEECVLEDGQTSCRCMTGFQRALNGQCIDVDECRLGAQERGHNCPINSTCNNTIGSFDCFCDAGFDMAIRSGGIRRCEDVDECEMEPCQGANMQCNNLVGSYECMCQTGYAFNDDGECTPVCDPPCQNGGACVSPSTCSCIPGYTGMNCEDDIDECASPSTNNCHGSRAECINTRGGHFCRCSPGYDGNGTHCEDVDECASNIHNCVEGSVCINTNGYFVCLCPDSNGIMTNCTGMCKRRSVLIENGGWKIDNCINCTCLNGERSCRRAVCDCSNPGDVPSECCNCNRRVCNVPLTSGKVVQVRPSFFYFDPSDRCQRYECFRNFSYSHTNLSANCPTLNCPTALQTLPMGKCCPVCMLPTCTDQYERKVISFRNGCETCTCSSGEWDCQDKVQCPEINCSPENIVFNKDGCCPVCVETVLQLGNLASCLAT